MNQEKRIKVVKEETGTSAFNQACDKFQATQDKAHTRQLLGIVCWKAHGRITQCQIIMIFSTVLQSIYDKVWTDLFAAVNLHPRHCLYFSRWFKKITPSINTAETTYFRISEGYYYNTRPSIWKFMTVLK